MAAIESSDDSESSDDEAEVAALRTRQQKYSRRDKPQSAPSDKQLINTRVNTAEHNSEVAKTTTQLYCYIHYATAAADCVSGTLSVCDPERKRGWQGHEFKMHSRLIAYSNFSSQDLGTNFIITSTPHVAAISLSRTLPTGVR
ncbi:unnamed protein product [Trichogramma brassicae]|uniref:Uncharacterized protein n=1 Tax=Trichogramma brassicae TaxID=86971 RepID=A0A6H5IVS8_9HYME|nr:unnamed protein product [Trichogramma brassicae]